MSALDAIWLSLVQGATEFLPVSSSGHLVLARQMLGNGVGRIDDNVLFAIVVHVGTLLAVVAVYRHQLTELLRYACVDGWRETRRQGARAAWLIDPTGRAIVATALATVPTAELGLWGRNYFESLFNAPHRVGWALLATGLLLALTWRHRRPQNGAPAPAGAPAYAPFPLWIALAVGIAQGMAITPGISRSGATISIALLLGLDRKTAGDFSFLIFIPAMCGAFLVRFLEFDPASLTTDPGLAGVLALALVVSAVSGWLCLNLLLRFVRGGQFCYFAVYCFIIGGWAIFHDFG